MNQLTFLNSQTNSSKLKIGLVLPDDMDDPNIVSEFVRMFPNLRRLQMTAATGFVEEACLCFEHLEELILWFPSVNMSLDEVVLPLVELTEEEILREEEQPYQIMDPSLVEPVMFLQSEY